MQTRLHAFRSLRDLGLALVISAGLGSVASAQAPDLIALSVQGPGQAEIGAVTNVNTLVVNLGGPLVENIQFDILLSKDLVIDAQDTVVASVSVAFVGALNNGVLIPESLTPGTYNWALRVTPQPGETVTFNNEIIGGQVTLFVIDLCVSSTKQIDASAVQGGDDPPSHSVLIANCGSGGSILIFTVTQEPPVPWLTVNPTTSFAIAGGQAQPIQIAFNAAGLPVGLHATQLRIANFQDPTDFDLIPVTLTIGEASFDAGDALIGEITSGGEEDVARFEAVQGMKLGLAFTTSFGNLKGQVDIVDDQDTVVASFKFKSGAQQQKKTFKAPATGSYLLRVTGREGTLGAYVLDTSRKLPKKAVSQDKKLTAPAGGTAELAVRALNGAELGFLFEPTKSFTGDLTVAFMAEDGQVIDLTSMLQSTASGGLELQGLPLVLGDYTLEIGGFEGENQKVKAKVEVAQPAEGTATVLLP